MSVTDKTLFWAGETGGKGTEILCDQCMAEDPEYYLMLQDNGLNGFLAERVDVSEQDPESPRYECAACGFTP